MGSSYPYLTRVEGLREVKIKYICAYFSYEMSLFVFLLTEGHNLDFNLSPDAVWSKSNISL